MHVIRANLEHMKDGFLSHIILTFMYIMESHIVHLLGVFEIGKD